MYQDPRGSTDRSNSAGASRGSFYPVLGQNQPAQQSSNHRPPPPPPSPQTAQASTSGSSQNPLLRVEIAAQYRTPPPVLLRQDLESVPRTQTAFEFDLERRILAEDANGAAPAAAQNVEDPFQLVLERYMQMGYEREEVAMALAAHDGQEEQGQVVEFCKNYRQLKSMGFGPSHVAGALMLHKGDLAAATEACLTVQS